MITTERLRLRKPTFEELNSTVALWMRDEETMKFTGGVRSPEKIETTFQFLIKQWEEHGFGPCLVFLQNTNELIGLVSLHKIEVEEEVGFDLGYMVAKNHWGKGYAFEACRGVIDTAFSDWGVERITAWPSSDHERSVRVLEKLGFSFTKKIDNQEINGNVFQNMNLYELKKA